MIKPARPPKLPIKVNYNFFAKELADASLELGRLDGLQRDLPNPSLLIAPLTTKEATVSSRVEGTKSTVSDVLTYEALQESKYEDTIEVVNYKRAMIWAIEELKRRKFNLAFIKELHAILLEKSRGEEYRGKFREVQVFIGEKGSTIEKATYIPPEPVLVQEYMENLEEYILSNDENPLVKSAIIHYQFEAIHPFRDGNGRIGRLIIPLYLYQKGIIHQPILFLSGYFERNRDQYIHYLHLVDTQRKYEEWIKFFLISVKNQARETQELIYKIRDLSEKIRKITEDIKSPYIHKIIEFIFRRPIFLSKELSRFLKTNRVTTLRLLKRFEALNIISRKDLSKRKKKIYIFNDLVKLLM